MDLQTIGLTLHTAGTLLIGFAALMVHHRVSSQAIIDRTVTRAMRLEQKLGIVGLFLVLIGYILQIL